MSREQDYRLVMPDDQGVVEFIKRVAEKCKTDESDDSVCFLVGGFVRDCVEPVYLAFEENMQ